VTLLGATFGKLALSKLLRNPAGWFAKQRVLISDPRPPHLALLAVAISLTALSWLASVGLRRGAAFPESLHSRSVM